jgi:hypothetical protein
MKTVKLTKVKGKEGSSIPLGYWIIGTEVAPPEVGKGYFLDFPVYTSDPEEYFDWFLTTGVKKISKALVGKHKFIKTKNSTWKLQYKKPVKSK